MGAVRLTKTVLKSGVWHGVAVRADGGEDPSPRLTAWHLERYLRQLSQQAALPLTFKLAVSQGDVVAGYIDSLFQPEFIVEGEPVRLAQQVAEVAPSVAGRGARPVGVVTRKNSRRWTCRPTRPRTLRSPPASSSSSGRQRLKTSAPS